MYLKKLGGYQLKNKHPVGKVPQEYMMHIFLVLQVCVITGKGPQKQFYLNKIMDLELQVKIFTNIQVTFE